MASAPTQPWKSPYITTWDTFQSRTQPTDSAEEAFIAKDSKDTKITTRRRQKRCCGSASCFMHLTCKMQVFFTVWGGLNHGAKAIEIKFCKTAWTLDHSRGSSPYMACPVHRER